MVSTATTSADGLDAKKVHYVDVDGVRTRYYEDGSGDPLLLVHGGNIASFYSLEAWSLNLPGLAERFHVYAVDKLGQGYTDNPSRDEDYSYDAQYRHFSGFVQTLGMTNVSLVGHSRGALPVSQLALEHPELVSKLVIVDSNTAAANHPSFAGGKFYIDIRNRTPAGPPTLESVRMEADGQSHSTAHVTDAFVAGMLAIAQQPKLQEAARKLDELNMSTWTPSIERGRRDLLRAIDDRGFSVPTLLVWGVNDPSAPLPLGYQIFERIALKTAQAELHVFNGAGHYSFREHPAAFDRVLAGFLQP